MSPTVDDPEDYLSHHRQSDPAVPINDDYMADLNRLDAVLGSSSNNSSRPQSTLSQSGNALLNVVSSIFPSLPKGRVTPPFMSMSGRGKQAVSIPYQPYIRKRIRQNLQGVNFDQDPHSDEKWSKYLSLRAVERRGQAKLPTSDSQQLTFSLQLSDITR